MKECTIYNVQLKAFINICALSTAKGMIVKMSINRIDEYNNTAMSSNSNVNTTKNTTETEKTNNQDNTVKNVLDKLDLGSYSEYLTGFLNYNASGKYSNIPAIQELLNDDSSNTDLAELLSGDDTGSLGQMPSLTDYLGDDGSSEDTSIEDSFNQIGEELTAYNDTLISQALSKYFASKTEKSSEDTKDDTKEDSEKDSTNSDTAKVENG